MSEADKIAESVNKIAEAFSGLSEGAKLRDEVARLKAIKAQQGGEVAKLNVKVKSLEGEVKRRKTRAEKDANLIEELYGRINAANGVADNFKNAAEDLSKKLWEEREKVKALNSDSNPHRVSGLHGVSGLRKEIARLKAINAKLSVDVTKKTVELQGQHEEIRDLREELNFREVEIKELKGSLERVQKAAEDISKSNAQLRERVADLSRARDAYRQDGIDLRDVLAEIRRAIDHYDDEED